jgi:hypothetical protein
MLDSYRANSTILRQEVRPVFYADRKQFRDFQEIVSRSEPGTTLHLPEGVVELSSGVRVSQSIRLKGRGMGRTILRADKFCLSFSGQEGDSWILEDLTLDNTSSDYLAVIDAHSLWPPLARFRWPCLRREEGVGPEAGPFGTGPALRGQLVQVGVQLSSGGSTSVTA